MKFLLPAIFFFITTLTCLAEFPKDTITDITDIEADTIYLISDTLRITDTVVIYTEEPSRPHAYLSLSGGLGVPFYKYKSDNANAGRRINTETETTPGLVISSSAGISYKKIMFESGIDFFFQKEKLFHSPENILLEPVLHYRYDTIDIRYQVTGTDTIWEYITEPNPFYINDSIHLNNPYINHFIFLEIPFYIGYNILKEKNMFYIKGGLAASFLISDPNNIILPDKDRLLSRVGHSYIVSPLISVNAGIGIVYFFNDILGINISLHIRKYLNSSFTENYLYKRRPLYTIFNSGLFCMF